MIKISFVGDVTCDRPFLQAANKEDGYDFTGAFEHISDVLKSSDYAVGNLETTFCGDKVAYNKGIHYNTPDSFVDELKRSGLNLFTTANNHCFDGGMDGLLRTRKIMLDNGFELTGTYSDKVDNAFLVKSIGGIKIAFVSYTYSVNMYSDIKIPDNVNDYINLLRPCKSQPYKKRLFDKLFSYNLRRKIKILLGRPTISSYTDKFHPSLVSQEYLNRISEQIKKAKSEADLVVFCLHIGGQFNETPGEYSEYVMNFLKEQGVDVVIGHHPHTIQKTVTEYNSRIYAYSLGGFNLSPSAIYINHECKPEYSQILNIYIDENSKEIVKCGFSFAKVVEDENAFLSVIPASDLYRSCDDKAKEELLNDIKSLYIRITGKEHTHTFVCDEYVLFDLIRS